MNYFNPFKNEIKKYQNSELIFKNYGINEELNGR